MFDIPILLIIYKRKDTTEKLISQLRLLQPKFIFVAADGPKNDIDIEKCNETRLVIDSIDWNCKINKLYYDKNLGVAIAPKTAISWFFEQNDMGIILEDDILPALDFFPFCEELLIKYKDEPKVMHISAMNFHYGKSVVKESYYFSKVISPWGWASWRRAWKSYDFEMPDFYENINKLSIPDFYKKELKRCKDEKQKFTWDYQWLYAVLKNNGVGIVPSKNLALNIGFDQQNASHTFSIPDWVKKMTLNTLTITKHPREIKVNNYADELTFKEIIGGYKPGFLYELKQKLSNLF